MARVPRRSLYAKTSVMSLCNIAFFTYLGQVAAIEMILSVAPLMVAKASILSV
jgi:hypothetical protein